MQYRKFCSSEDPRFDTPDDAKRVFRFDDLATDVHDAASLRWGFCGYTNKCVCTYTYIHEQVRVSISFSRCSFVSFFYASLLFQMNSSAGSSPVTRDGLQSLKMDISCTRSVLQKSYFCDWNRKVRKIFIAMFCFASTSIT